MEWPHGRPFGLMGPLTLRGTWKLIPTASGGRHVDITVEWCCAVHLPVDIDASAAAAAAAAAADYDIEIASSKTAAKYF